jgi:hypothetical protein
MLIGRPKSSESPIGFLLMFAFCGALINLSLYEAGGSVSTGVFQIFVWRKQQASARSAGERHGQQSRAEG